VNKIDQLRLEMRVMRTRFEARLEALEARRDRRKRQAAPRPDARVIADRERLWARYIELEMRFGHGRCKLSKLSFAVRHRLNPTEFCRWFSATYARGIAAGSGPDLRFREALTGAITELEARAEVLRNGSAKQVMNDSHGNNCSAQYSGVRLH
jgi:hypothetical protein